MLPLLPEYLGIPRYCPITGELETSPARAIWQLLKGLTYFVLFHDMNEVFFSCSASLGGSSRRDTAHQMLHFTGIYDPSEP